MIILRSRRRVGPWALTSAIVLALTSFLLSAPPASASSWAGAGEYVANSSFVDTYVREYPDGITLGDVTPGAHIQVLGAPQGSYVYARIMGNSNGDNVNICAYIRFSPDSGGQNAYFTKVSGDTSTYQSTCPNTPLDGGGRVPASRYAQSRTSASNEGGTQPSGCPNNTEHGYDNYWYSGYLSDCGFIAGVPTTTHGACPLYRTHDWSTNYAYGSAYPRGVQAGDELRVRFFVPDGSHVMVDLRYPSGGTTLSEWGFISSSCLTDSRF